MRRILAVLAIFMVAAAFPSVASMGGLLGRSTGRSMGDEQKAADARAENKLLGTWKMVEAKYGGTPYKPPEGTTELKHVTAVHWVLTVFDKEGKVGVVMGGPYALKGISTKRRRNTASPKSSRTSKGNRRRLLGKWKETGGITPVRSAAD